MSFIVDQHRLQPWAYQTAIYAVVIATLPPRLRSTFRLIAVAASVYIYSALGKFDYQFAYTVGQDFLETLMVPFDGLPEQWDRSVRESRVAIPSGELAIGIGLLIPTTRRLAASAVILMHAVLLAILGPWGLHHSAGVLIWNIALLLQAYLLIIRMGPQRAIKHTRYSNRWPMGWSHSC